MRGYSETMRCPHQRLILFRRIDRRNSAAKSDVGYFVVPSDFRKSEGPFFMEIARSPPNGDCARSIIVIIVIARISNAFGRIRFGNNCDNCVKPEVT
jgi:hypothetical protein